MSDHLHKHIAEMFCLAFRFFTGILYTFICISPGISVYTTYLTTQTVSLCLQFITYCCDLTVSMSTGISVYTTYLTTQTVSLCLQFITYCCDLTVSMSTGISVYTTYLTAQGIPDTRTASAMALSICPFVAASLSLTPSETFIIRRVSVHHQLKLHILKDRPLQKVHCFLHSPESHTPERHCCLH